MNPHFHETSPLRLPQWRAERVFKMLEHRPKPSPPRDYDDCFVREYRRFLIAFSAASNDADRLQATIAAHPHAYRAHMLRFAPDVALRQITEAWLLTTESYGEIGERLSTDEKSIDYYEKLFFNVRDRLHARGWIAKIIWGLPTDRAASTDGVMTENQRGIIYRWYGHCGGPLVLDTMVAALSPGAMPKRAEDIAPWFDDALAKFIHAHATTAAQLLDITSLNALPLIKLALRIKRTIQATSGTATDAEERHAEKILEALQRNFPELFGLK